MNMDKFDIALDITEHPEKYTDTELAALLADPEIREIYDALCASHSSLLHSNGITQAAIENEWQKFANDNDAFPLFYNKCPLAAERDLPGPSENGGRKIGFSGLRHWLDGRRVAVVISVVTVSVAALAIGVGVISRSASEKMLATQTAEVVSAAGVVNYSTDTLPDMKTENVINPANPVIFENETLGNILKELAAHYGFEVEVINEQTVDIHLYFRWDPACDASEVIRQLNKFDRINLKLQDNIVTVR